LSGEEEANPEKVEVVAGHQKVHNEDAVVKFKNYILYRGQKNRLHLRK
jgi:hypothetical protein